ATTSNGNTVNDSLADVIGTLTRQAGENVGRYNVRLGSGSRASNYDITFAADNQAFVIDPARLTVTGTKVYDATQLFASDLLTVMGVNGETLTVSGSALMTSKNVQTNQSLADVSGLVLGDGTGLRSNYLPISVSDTSISVTPAKVTLTPTNARKTYDGSILALAGQDDLATLSSQLLGDDEVSQALMVFDGSDVVRAADGSVLANRVVSISSLQIDDGNNGANYALSFADANNGRIDPAALTIAAADDAKFVRQPDPVFGAIIVNGFVAGEDASVFTATGTITRTNAAAGAAGEAAGLYQQVLQPLGWAANNYDITYVNGDFTIVAADQLLVRANGLEATYGEIQAGQPAIARLDPQGLVAQYLENQGQQVVELTVVYEATLDRYLIDDGAGNRITFNLKPTEALPSSNAGFARVGGYRLTFDDLDVTNSNFNQAVMVGSLAVTPKLIDNPFELGTVTKPFDGNRLVQGVSFDGQAWLQAGVEALDAVEVLGGGLYDTPAVGTGKPVTFGFGLFGEDAVNYRLLNPIVSKPVGIITSVDPVPPVPDSLVPSLAGVLESQVDIAKNQQLVGYVVQQPAILYTFCFDDGFDEQRSRARQLDESGQSTEADANSKAEPLGSLACEPFDESRIGESRTDLQQK
ncbi:MAG: YDG domain-containing protein, partial [Burkholderiaceae bacterium]|nr:YDG domain-containing protein [Burkholderiaceae bacterium]